MTRTPAEAHAQLNGRAAAFEAGGADASLDAAAVPSALRSARHWVGWKLVQRDGRPTKVPVALGGGGPADCSDPATFGSFDEATTALRSGSGLAGVGFVFTPDDPFAGVDLDGCIDDHGGLAPGARAIVEALGSYTEISPSGRGVKTFIKGQKPAWARCRSRDVPGFKQIEVYDRARFFAVTGRRLAGAPAEVEERQSELESLCRRFWPPDAARRAAGRCEPDALPGDDVAIIDRARAAAGGNRFARLWEGDISLYAGDHSAADLALCNALAFWTGCDRARMDALFRRSGLYRAKWDERRGATTYGWMTIDRAIADHRAQHRRDGAIESPALDGPCIALGARDPLSGRIVLSPRRTLPTAQAYIHEFHTHSGRRTLHCYGGTLFEWRDNCYRPVETESIAHRLQPWLDGALRPKPRGAEGHTELAPFESNPATVQQALTTIRTAVHLPASTISPSWLDGDADRPPALELLPCKSATLHIPTGRQLEPTPSLFTTNALDFDYDPNPEPPQRFMQFLEQVFGDDAESSQLLQEWLGYCLTGDTHQQKILLLVGPRRSGKGTIGRIATRLVGKSSVVGPTASSLAGAFGLQPLIGKSLAIVSDARFAGEGVSTVVERLLCISGEDYLSVDRKFLGAVTMKLHARFMLLTNELPRLNDASTALAGRFLVLRLTNSFYGREDPRLYDDLVRELPGILAWAIEGWKQLQSRGHFLQPQSAKDAVRDIEDLASPVSAFVRERCVIGPGRRTSVDDLYANWRGWCELDGRTAVTNRQAFGRDLMAVAPGVRRRRGTGMVAFYEGIALRGVS